MQNIDKIWNLQNSVKTWFKTIIDTESFNIKFILCVNNTYITPKNIVFNKSSKHKLKDNKNNLNIKKENNNKIFFLKEIKEGASDPINLKKENGFATFLKDALIPSIKQISLCELKKAVVRVLV